jgi:hypothetical protein
MEPGDFYGERYSIAYFNQARKSAMIQGPQKKYPLVTGEEFTRNAMQRNYQALLAKTAQSDLQEKPAATVSVKEVVVA